MHPDTHTGYNVEVLHWGEWTPTNERNLSYTDARNAMRAWLALGCSSRMVDAS